MRMKFATEPIDHKPPLPRIDLSPLRRAEPLSPGEREAEALARSAEIIEGERMWVHVKQIAEGTAMPVVAAADDEAPTATDIDMSGWDAA